MGKPMADYVKLPELEEYREWFKEHFDLYREDGILQITLKTQDGPMHWSGANHRALSQLSRIISLDRKNEILIWTHKGPNWMLNNDPNGWDTYAEERFDHQYIDDYNLFKNMIFDIDVPTIGALPGPGFHWDCALLSDITIGSEDLKFEDAHLFDGLVAGDGMFLIMQHFMGTKRANYYVYTARQWTAQQALDWGWINELVPKDKVLERAWEIARIIKSLPRETRTIQSQLCKRPLERLFVNDLKLHTVSEQYSTMIRINAKDYGIEGIQLDEKDMSLSHNYRLTPGENEYLQDPIKDWAAIYKDMPGWAKKTGYKAPGSKDDDK
jgi:Enoyl-CoA hydratase/carnithine racemase